METQKPNWWVLYLSVPISVGAVAFVLRMGLAPFVTQLASIAIVVLGFAWMGFWMHHNEAAIERQEFETERRERIVASPVSAHRSLAPANLKPSIRLDPLKHPQTGFGSGRVVVRTQLTEAQMNLERKH
jgi:hypothetical protein